jgi:hypothetical protein
MKDLEMLRIVVVKMIFKLQLFVNNEVECTMNVCMSVKIPA